MSRPQAALFVTCLADLMRPEVGEATATLMARAGFDVVVPRQGCCGQPNYNAGDRAGARVHAKAAIQALEPYETIVVPSGSCGGMLAKHYPTLFDDADPWAARAKAVAARVLELTQFLTRHPLSSCHPGRAGVAAETRDPGATGVAFAAPGSRVADASDGLARDDKKGLRVAYHDSCSSLREMGVQAEPRALLAAAGVEVIDLKDAETCCGFGGLFCVKYPEIADKIADDKCAAVIATGCDVLAAGDLGCLLNIGGKLQRMGAKVRAVHIAELLAGAP